MISRFGDDYAMNCCYRLLVVFLIVEAATDASEKFPDRIVSTDGKLVRWTAAWPTDTRVEFLGASELNLQMTCQYPGGGNVTKGIICFMENSSNPSEEKCATLHAGFRAHDLQVGPAKAKVTFDPSSGLQAAFRRVPQDAEMPLMFAQCTLDSAEQGAFKSNQLFLLDFRKNFPTKLWKPTTPPQLPRNSPSTVKCLQTGLGIDERLKQSKELYRQPAVPVAFAWVLCSDDNAEVCANSKRSVTSLAPFMKWPVQVGADGELYSPFVPEEVASQLEGKRLMCIALGKPVAFYPPVTISASKPTERYPSMKRPVRTEKVLLYNSSNYAITLPCLFKTPPAPLSVVWRSRKGELTTTLDAGRTYKDQGVSVSAHSDAVTLRGPFSEKAEAYVSCTVTVEDNPVTGSYLLVVKGAPRVEAGVPQVVDLPLCGTASLPCRFENMPRVIPSLDVMGTEINFDSVATINITKASINKNYKTDINFTLNLVRPRKGDVVVFSEWNQYRRPESHFITCVGMRPPFTQRQRIEVKSAFEIRAKAPGKCVNSCEMTCGVDPALAKHVTVDVAWFLQNDSNCASDGTAIDKGETVKYSVPSDFTSYLRCSVRLSSPTCGRRFAEKCKVFLVSFEKKKTYIWYIVIGILLLVIIGILCCWCLRRKRRGSSERTTNRKESVRLSEA